MKPGSILLLSSFLLYSLPKILNVMPRTAAAKRRVPSGMACSERPQPTVEVIHGSNRTIVNVSAVIGPEPK
jgi:hypothetical protein